MNQLMKLFDVAPMDWQGAFVIAYIVIVGLILMFNHNAKSPD